jgi:tripartite-type tricarboxylate transporter receptor subunit TctC
LPDVPTVSELGYKDFEIELWYGVFAPAHTPQQTVSKFAEWFANAAQVPQARSRLLTQGIDTSAVCGAAFASDLHKRFDEYGSVIHDANIKAE